MKLLFTKHIAMLTLSIFFSMFAQAQRTCTSTGTGNWASSFNCSGSGTTTYIIQSGHNITLNSQETNIGNVQIYGTLTMNNGQKLTMASAASTIEVFSGGSITGGNGGSQFVFPSDNIQGSFSVSGPSYAIDGFTSFAGGALPVSWLQVQAYMEGNLAVIDWKTASEYNNSHFEIERAGADGVFTPIGTVAGNGNSNAIISYRFEDHNFSSEQRFYRIKQVDFDGAYENSAVMRLAGDEPNAGHVVVAFPTLISLQQNSAPQITLNNLSEGDVALNVYDLSGRTLVQKQLSIGQDGSSAIVSLGDQLKTGYYLLNVNTQTGTQSIRILITE